MLTTVITMVSFGTRGTARYRNGTISYYSFIIIILGTTQIGRTSEHFKSYYYYYYCYDIG